MTKKTRRRKTYWPPHNWTGQAAPTGPSPWAETEAWLRELEEAGAAVTGAAGVWRITWPSGLAVTVSAETDAARREEAAILGTGAR